MGKSGTQHLAEQDAFLQAIHETPDDTAPRLVFADWLEEQGDPIWTKRAELIRVQLELARPSPRNKSKRRRAALQFRERELLATLPEEWLGTWAAVPFRWVFRRGMPERITALGQGQLIAESGHEHLEFHADGQIRRRNPSPFSSWYFDRWYEPALEGDYQLRFTFAEVRVAIQLWHGYRDEELRLEGHLVRRDGRVALDLAERPRKGKRRGEAGTLALSALDSRPAD